MTKLKIADNLSLPLEAATETLAVLGIRGSGKTNTAAVVAEELLRAGQQVVILDPTDGWWGLKSSAEGTAPGYPVVVLGGKHGDLPLNAGDGKLIADFVVEQGASVVCSLRGFESKNQELAFATAFLRRLYHLKGQQDAPTPITLFIDEASRLVPQRVMGEDAACVGAVQQIVRQGRSSGFGVVLIDQRAATVNKDVLAQLEMMVVHRTTGPQDRKALREWIEAHDTEGHEKEFLESLASLKQGEAWFWSPGWLDLFRRVEVRKRRTFDSSRTPRAGEIIVAPKKIADVDLEGLRVRLATTIEKAKADDPKELRKEIAALKVENRKLSAADDKPTSKAALQDEYRRGFAEGEAKATVAIARADIAGMKSIRDQLLDYQSRLGGIASRMSHDVERLDSAIARASAMSSTTAKANHEVPERRPVAASPSRSPATQRAPLAPRADVASDSSLPQGERAVLIAIAQYPDGAEREQLTVLTGYKRSSRDTYIQRLSARGYVEARGGRIVATQAGVDALGSDYDPLPTGRALQEYWLNRLPAGEKKVLEVLLDAGGDPVARDVITERTDYLRSSRDTYLQRLSSRRLVESVGRGEVRASATLFEG